METPVPRTPSPVPHCWDLQWSPLRCCMATPVQTGSPLACHPLWTCSLPCSRDSSPQAQEAAGKALHAQGWTLAAWPWCRELDSLILSGWIRFAEAGCVNSQAGLVANGGGSGSAGWAGAVLAVGGMPRTSFLQLPQPLAADHYHPTRGYGLPGPAKHQVSCRRGSGREPVDTWGPLPPRGCSWTSGISIVLEMQSSGLTQPHRTSIYFFTRVQEGPWCHGRLRSTVTRGTFRGQQQVPFDLALAHFGIYLTEAIRGIYVGTFDLVMKHLPWMFHSIFAATLGDGSPRLTQVWEARVTQPGHGRVRN